MKPYFTCLACGEDNELDITELNEHNENHTCKHCGAEHHLEINLKLVDRSNEDEQYDNYVNHTMEEL